MAFSGSAAEMEMITIKPKCITNNTVEWMNIMHISAISANYMYMYRYHKCRRVAEMELAEV